MPLPTYRGFVNAWQADENAHLNVQFFTAFAHDACVHFHAMLGLTPGSGLRGKPVQDHIRYIREMQVADAVEVRSHVLAIGESTLDAYHEIRCAYDDGVAGTVRRTTRCVDASGAERPWPKAMRDAAAKLVAPLPDHAKARTVGTLPPRPDWTLADALGVGLFEICRDVILPAECDARGELLPRHVVGRYSDGGAYLWKALGFDRAAMRDRMEGSVVLEMGHEWRRPLRAGARAVVMSGVLGVAPKTFHIAHCLFDADTGLMAAASEGVAGLFDQKARRILPIPPDMISVLEARRVRLS